MTFLYAVTGNYHGPYGLVVVLLATSCFFIFVPEGFLKFTLLFDPPDEAGIEKFKSKVRKIGYVIVALALIYIVVLISNHTPVNSEL